MPRGKTGCNKVNKNFSNKKKISEIMTGCINAKKYLLTNICHLIKVYIWNCQVKFHGI